LSSHTCPRRRDTASTDISLGPGRRQCLAHSGFVHILLATLLQCSAVQLWASAGQLCCSALPAYGAGPWQALYYQQCFDALVQGGLWAFINVSARRISSAADRPNTHRSHMPESVCMLSHELP
jgi:hypothetical protein